MEGRHDGAMQAEQTRPGAISAPVVLAVDNVRKAAASKADWQAIFDVANMIDTFSTMPKVMQNATGYVRALQDVIERT